MVKEDEQQGDRPMTFAQHLDALGWTQGEFARVLTYLSGAPQDRGTINRWARGRMRAKPAVIALLVLLCRLSRWERADLLAEASKGE
jgi:hypothetical protein